MPAGISRVMDAGYPVGQIGVGAISLVLFPENPLASTNARSP